MSQTDNSTTTSKNPTGKGMLLPEIGMGILAEILGFFIFAMWHSRSCVCASHERCEPIELPDPELVCGIENKLYVFALPLFVIIPIIAEFVHLGGKLSGGHKKRKLCYLGTAIGTIILILMMLLLKYSMVVWALFILSCPVIRLLGAIIGYRCDASEK